MRVSNFHQHKNIQQTLRSPAILLGFVATVQIGSRSSGCQRSRCHQPVRSRLLPCVSSAQRAGAIKGNDQQRCDAAILTSACEKVMMSSTNSSISSSSRIGVRGGDLLRGTATSCCCELESEEDFLGCLEPLPASSFLIFSCCFLITFSISRFLST